MSEWRDYVRDRLPSLPCPPETQHDIVEELAQQLEDVYRAARAAGATDEEACRRVGEEVGDWPALASALLAARYPRTASARAAAGRFDPLGPRPGPGPAATAIGRELRHAVRSLRASPIFTLASTVTLALGLGATTAVFSLVFAVILEPLPFREPDRLAVVKQVVPEIADRYPLLGANPRSFTAWARECRASCEALAALTVAQGTLTGSGEPEGVTGARVSSNFFALLGVPLLHGRSFTVQESRPGADDVVVLSHALWVRRFGGDPAVLGRSIELDGRRVQVVGVLGASTRLPRFEHFFTNVWVRAGVPEFFRPLGWSEELLRSWGEYDNVAILRLKPGATVSQAQAELDALTAAEFREAPIHPHTHVRLLGDTLLSSWRRPLALLLASVLAALAIACVNIANLMGGRWIARRRELAIRTAMGARFGDLVRLVAVEGALIAGLGGALGLLAAFAALEMVGAIAPVSIPRIEIVRFDHVSFLFGLVATVVCAMACSLLPAWHAARTDAAEALKAGSHTQTETRGSAAVRRWLVGAEVALTSALLVVGGLLVVSLWNVLHVEAGFQTARILAVDVKLPAARYPDGDSRARFFDALLAAVRALPGAEAAGIVRVLPLEGEATVDAIAPAGDPRPIVEHPVGNHLQVSPGYFSTLGLSLIEGRWMTEADRGRNVALVSQRTARTVWPGQSPLGGRFVRSQRGREWEVVGVVGDARIRGLDQEPGLVAYVPYWSGGTASEFSLVVRTAADPASVLAGLRHAVATLDRQLPLQRVRTMDAVLDATLASRRFLMWVIMAFGAAALLLACLGVYAVIAAAVERRTVEFALRLALGASPLTIARAVLRHGLGTVVAGLVVGLAGGVTAAMTVASLLFGVAAHEPRVVAGVAVVMLSIAVGACLGPMLRATRTDPVSALRRV